MMIKTRDYALITLLVLFAGKYVQITWVSTNISILGIVGDALLAIAAILVILLSIKLIDKYKNAAIVLGAGALAFAILHAIFTFSLLYLAYQILLVLAFFIFLYPLHHYETKKYDAFGSAFLMIYVLTEGISIWRGQYNVPIFGIYLTLSLSMFIPGILKIKSD